MSKQVQFRRGTTAEHATFKGAVGEITIDTDKDVAVVHDNVKMGGYALLREDKFNELFINSNHAVFVNSFTINFPTNHFSISVKKALICTSGNTLLYFKIPAYMASATLLNKHMLCW